MPEFLAKHPPKKGIFSRREKVSDGANAERLRRLSTEFLLPLRGGNC